MEILGSKSRHVYGVGDELHRTVNERLTPARPNIMEPGWKGEEDEGWEGVAAPLGVS